MPDPRCIMPISQPALNRRGFTLLQVSVILTVAAVILASTLPGQTAGDYNQKTMDNIRKLDKIEERMVTFMAKNGRRPCPADGQYFTNSNNFGLEAGTGSVAGVKKPNIANCQGGVPAAPMGPDAGTGNIVAGTIPTKTLDLPDEYAFDAWGRQFTYVVDTRATTVSACYALQTNVRSGIMQNGVIPKSGIQIKATTGGTVNDTAMYAFISHGPDGFGAFPAQGSNVAGRINTGSTDTDEQTNAGVDASFNYNTTTFTNARVKKDRTATFDDLVYYHADDKDLCCVGASCGFANPGGFKVSGNNGNPGFGSSVISMDINGDGIPDLVIGVPGAGMVYVIFGTKLGFATNPWILGNGMAAGAINGSNGFIIGGTTGASLAAGDVNGDGIQDGSPRPPEPNGSEPSNGSAASFRLDFDRQVHHCHLGRSLPRSPDDLPRDGLRSSTPPGEAAMTKANKRPGLSQEQRTAIEAIRARAREERPGPDELIDRGELDELVPHAQYLEVRALGTRMREIREGRGLSLTDVSERSGLTRAVVSRLDNGWNLNPTLETPRSADWSRDGRARR